MIENFLRRPQTVSEVIADTLRLVGLLSVIAASIWSTATDAGILALALPALLVPRFVGVRSSFDIVYQVIVLAAAWSNVLDFYRTVDNWDLILHFSCTAVLAAMAYLVLVRFSITPDPRTEGFARRTAIVLVTVLGLAASAVWEMIEWVGYAFITDEIFVTYPDTIGDMAVGGLGSLVAGIVLAFVRLDRSDA
ncbi:DUF2238 domain-containing protein [Microbacterium sp. zg-Y818]|uniref:DUF2238 domain-containing protein n=1 Tax=unclassified Microbacterium TaxID=2609290 RepID=UPI00214C5D6A|nr:MULTISPECIES: DUF2238 domain-containing protein [unclassified Microbacterium]MCR2799722.1 DUF2238 domain-containing protein [Microbacterium sp. zg.Y818]WIM21710.1 DUF2238 domain-containing protein [Microbacterium sp. zg-Y818]